mgnify:FL=1
MKLLLTTLTIATLAVTPFAYTADPAGNISQAIKVGSDYGITHFTSIEFEGSGRMEIEGWIDQDWHVELETRAGSPDLVHEEREKRLNGAWGMTADDVLLYTKAAAEAGIVDIEEVKINRRDRIEVEGDDVRGRDLEVYFERGNQEPMKVSRDD